jgi:hypothetical protein
MLNYPECRGRRPHMEASCTYQPPRSALIHQAAGMISIQLGITVEDALFRLEARAVTDDRPLIEVAKDVIDRKVRFDS